MIVILAEPVTEEFITDSNPVHLGTPITSYIPYIEWIAYMIFLILGIIFIVRIGVRVIKLLDLMIIEKKAIKDNKKKIQNDK